MKKTFAALTALVLAVAVASPASAAPKRKSVDPSPSILECGLFFIPANCSPVDRIRGGAIVGAVAGFGVGAIVGASGGAITGGALAANTTMGVAGSYAVIGAGAGATTGLLVAR